MINFEFRPVRFFFLYTVVLHIVVHLEAYPTGKDPYKNKGNPHKTKQISVIVLSVQKHSKVKYNYHIATYYYHNPVI